MLIAPRYHVNAAGRALIAELHLIEHPTGDEELPVWTDQIGHVALRGIECAERDSDSPLHDREVILYLVDADGRLVPDSVWSPDETAQHRQALKDEDVGGYLPFAQGA